MKPTIPAAYRFIPFRKRDIVEMCIQDARLAGQEDEFRQLHYMLSNIFHFEFHATLESLKDSYAACDPDTDTRSYGGSNSADDFVGLLHQVLEKANYEQVSQQELNQALTEESLFKIRLHVNFDDFSEVLLFCRGVSQHEETLGSLFGLMQKTIRFTNYDRVVVYIRFRDDYAGEHSGLPYCRPGATLLKLFQNVPKADLEMLFPNTSVRMRLKDKLLIGVPAVVSGGIVLTTKLGASLVLLGSLLGYWLGISSEPVELDQTRLMILLAGAAALGGYLWKQFNNFKNRKLRFTQALTQNLYFKNLDNNAGVFHRIVNDAEEEECKEAILAYYFLLTSDTPMSRESLDQAIEQWLSEQWQCRVDFEIDDALNKLAALKLLQETDGKLEVVSICEAIRVLDQTWDNYFVAQT